MRTKSQYFVISNIPYSTTYKVRVRGVSVVGMYGLFGEWSEQTSIDLAGMVNFHYYNTLNITILFV